jgi:hypothetical protein
MKSVGLCEKKWMADEESERRRRQIKGQELVLMSESSL